MPGSHKDANGGEQPVPQGLATPAPTPRHAPKQQTIRKGPPCPPTHGKVARLGTAFRGVNAQQGRRNHAAGTAQKTAKAPREARESNDESIPCGLTNDEAGDSIKVFVRVRPLPGHDRQCTEAGQSSSSVVITSSHEVAYQGPGNVEPLGFVFDHILGPECDQAGIFRVAGKAMVDNCIEGYNSCIFAYGQTGSGKTHTMMGDVDTQGSQQRGLAPRVFEYLFEKIIQTEGTTEGGDSVRFDCHCSFLEIYNEQPRDLLVPSEEVLSIRDGGDIQGPVVLGLSQKPVQNVDDVLSVMRQGLITRRVGETQKNRASSRSHAVFTCTVNKIIGSGADGVTHVVRSKLTIVDLAGSERYENALGGDAQALAKHQKESININTSLTALGRVISELEQKQGQPGGDHIPYRDSKLTFLLKDSLGGNAKTSIIANVSPLPSDAPNTLSTLQFAQRAKRVRTRAHVNKCDIQGNEEALKSKIAKLEREIEDMRADQCRPCEQCQELKTALGSGKEELAQVHAQLEFVTAEAGGYKSECDRLREQLRGLEEAHRSQARQLEALRHEATEKAKEAQAAAQLAAERQKLLTAQQTAAASLQSQLRGGIRAFKEAAAEMQSDIPVVSASLDADRDTVTAAVQAAQGEIEGLRGQLAASEAQLAAAQQQCDQQAAAADRLKQQLQDAQRQLAAGQAAAAEHTSTAEQLQLVLQEAQRQLGVEQAAAAAQSAIADEMQKELHDAHEQLAVQRAAAAAQRATADGLRGEISALQQQLAAAQQQGGAQAAGLQQQLQVAQQELAAVEQQGGEQADVLREEVLALQALLAVAQQQGAEHADVLRGEVQTLREQLAAAKQQAAEHAAAAEALQQQLTAAQQQGNQQGDVLQGEVLVLRGQLAAAQQQGDEQVDRLQQQLQVAEQQLAAELAAAAVQATTAANMQEQLQRKLQTAHRQLAAKQAQVDCQTAAAEQLQQELQAAQQQLAAAAERETQTHSLLSVEQATAAAQTATAAHLQQQLQAEREQLAADQAAAAAQAATAAQLEQQLQVTQQQLAAVTERETQAQLLLAVEQARTAQLAAELSEARRAQQQWQEQRAAVLAAVETPGAQTSDLQHSPHSPDPYTAYDSSIQGTPHSTCPHHNPYHTTSHSTSTGSSAHSSDCHAHTDTPMYTQGDDTSVHEECDQAGEALSGGAARLHLLSTPAGQEYEGDAGGGASAVKAGMDALFEYREFRETYKAPPHIWTTPLWQTQPAAHASPGLRHASAAAPVSSHVLPHAQQPDTDPDLPHPLERHKPHPLERRARSLYPAPSRPEPVHSKLQSVQSPVDLTQDTSDSEPGSDTERALPDQRKVAEPKKQRAVWECDQVARLRELAERYKGVRGRANAILQADREHRRPILQGMTEKQVNDKLKNMAKEFKALLKEAKRK